MTYEVEQKFPVGDTGQLSKELSELGAVAQPSVEQIDRYYAHPARDFAITDEVLRIRRVGEENFITYKGPKLDRTTKTRREIELPLPSGETGFNNFANLLEILGFNTVAEVRKTRRPFEIRWQDRIIHTALDDVTSVGTFVELELMVEADEVESAKACLASLADRLKLSESERRSYLELLLARTNS